MRVSFVSGSAKTISQLSLLNLLFLCVLIYVVIEMIIAVDLTESFLRLVGQPLALVEALSGGGSVSVALVGVLKLLGSLCGIVAGFNMMWVLISSSLYTVYTNSAFYISNLLRRKVIAEIDSASFFSGNDIDRGIQAAKSDYEVLHQAAEATKLNNSQLALVDWPLLENSVLYRQLLDISPAEDDFSIRHRDVLDHLHRLYEGAESEEPLVNFQVASVQPSLIAMVKLIQSKYNFGRLIKLSGVFSSGPQTVKHCMNERKRSPSDLPKQVFAAPLSAYITHLTDCSEDDPGLYFSPVVTLFPEVQQFITIENGSKTPVHHSRIFYYDNSTAEEYKAHVHDQLSHFTRFEAVTSYDKYKQLLRGEDQPDLGSLQPGDAIAVWPPLTEFFLGRRNGCGHFVENGISGITEAQSQIMLFCDRDVLGEPSDSAQAFAQYFIELLLLEIRRVKHQHNGVNSWFYKYVMTTRHLRGYKSVFLAMVK